LRQGQGVSFSFTAESKTDDPAARGAIRPRHYAGVADGEIVDNNAADSDGRGRTVPSGANPPVELIT